MPDELPASLPIPTVSKRRGRPPNPLGLPAWLLRYEQYRVLMPGKLTPDQQVCKATEFAGHPISYAYLRNLRHAHKGVLEEFRQMVLQESWAQAARKRLQALSLDGVDVMAASVNVVKAKLAVDTPEALKAISNEDVLTALKVVEPILDRVVPKRADTAVATQVNITLSPRQQEALAALDTPAVEVLDAEVLPAAS